MFKNFITSHSRTKGLLVVLALAVVAGGGTALAEGLGSSAHYPLGVGQSPSSSALSAIAQAYPVLGRAQQPSDIPPGRLLDPYVASQGGSLANIRRAAVTQRGESLYLVPANGAICMMSSDNVVQGCGQFPIIDPSQLVAIESAICDPNLPSSDIEVAAIMPPGASNVQVHYSDGSSQPVAVTNGVIAVTADRTGPLPASISWTGPQGQEQAGSSVPPDAAASPCAG